MTQTPPEDPAEHAREFALRWRDKLEQHCAVRMEDLGLPDNKIGEPDYAGSGGGTSSTLMVGMAAIP